MGINANAARLVAVVQQPTFKFLQALRYYHPSWAVLVGLAVLSLNLALLPFIARTWRATGDEPHYLLAAHSLVTDGDFDLTNNYENFDYLAFYFSKDINRQVVTNAAGQQILNHQLGLPVLITPAYALAGRLGVLAFQAILGGLLAVVTFKLAVHVSRDEKASLLATLFVTLSPPLFMYQYLVYPELMGALLTTLILYYALSHNKPTLTAATLVMLSLVFLPWLNRRFVPLAFVLAVLVVWAWRKPIPNQSSDSQPRRNRGFERSQFWRLAGKPTRVGLLSLIATAFSVAGLLWFNNQLSEPARIDIIAPEGTLVLWHRLGRGIGWLVDQQRGLFIFSPIYILTLWGLPILIQNSLKRGNRHWFILLPFVLSLGVTAVAGGYWVAWELGPRFLVVALPALAPLLALAWRYYSCHKLWLVVAVMLGGLSLFNSLMIVRNPEMPYKSSLAVFYGEKLGLPLTEILPDLAGYARVSVAEADLQKNQVVRDEGQPAWFAPAGRPRNVAQSPPLYQLPFGHYQLTWPVRVEPGLSPQTEVMRISANFLGGGRLFNKIVTAADVPAEGQYGLFQHAFINTNSDRWRTPIIFHAVSTGLSSIWARDIIFAPVPFYAWVLPYLYLLVLAGGGWLAWYRATPSNRNFMDSTALPLPKNLGWSLVLILPLVGLGHFAYQSVQDSRTYQMSELYHFVGRSISDPDATDGRAWLVDPAVDPPQKAVHGPFDIYDPGRYQVTFRIKLPEAVDTSQMIARLQVNATANLDELFTQPISSRHFSKPDLYHQMVLTIHNPRRQALSFELHYGGVAPLVIDEVTIAKISNTP